MKKLCFYIFFLLGSQQHAQQLVDYNSKSKHYMLDSKKAFIVYNKLFQYGIADAFVGGLYKGSLSVKDLKLKGNFGLGAPDLLDGELTILDGKVYQTKATGETIEPDNEFKTSLSFVTFFKPNINFIIEKRTDEKLLLYKISQVLSNKNAMYAIKISGKFYNVKTRAFPPVKNKPFPTLTSILDTQKVFDFPEKEGTLVGYYIPEYLNGINVKGFHFHFLSTDRKHGGHVLNFIGENLKIEIAELKSFELETSRDSDFQNFNFKGKDNEILKNIEQGY
ncbi:acetolactate decarboxylase [Elizabethkingia bruuniana]|uniref:acetolactate decarboxylase n=1 Tax=Elizabethkingia bruuniana TaxID=1756149 RepID=UPI0021A68DBE|nr:acetolactate decarboxylase [Elizabethkingia bruuniana]